MEDQYAKKLISILETLALIFITLKLCGAIQWSWWWVLSPLWILGLGILRDLLADFSIWFDG